MRAVLLACLLLAGCNGSSQEQAIDASGPLRTQTGNGQLTLYFSNDIPQVTRMDARDAAEEHLLELQYGVAPLVVAITGVNTFPSTPRRVFVHSRPFLQAPHAASQLGYVDTDSPGRDVHVVLGPGAVLPDLLHQLAHAEWYPAEVHDQAPTFTLNGQRVTLWDEIKARQDTLVSRLKFARGVP